MDLQLGNILWGRNLDPAERYNGALVIQMWWMWTVNERRVIITITTDKCSMCTCSKLYFSTWKYKKLTKTLEYHRNSTNVFILTSPAEAYSSVSLNIIMLTQQISHLRSRMFGVHQLSQLKCEWIYKCSNSFTVWIEHVIFSFCLDSPGHTNTYNTHTDTHIQYKHERM